RTQQRRVREAALWRCRGGPKACWIVDCIALVGFWPRGWRFLEQNDQFGRADPHIAALAPREGRGGASNGPRWRFERAAVALRTAGRSDREPSSETGSARPEQRFSSNHGLRRGVTGRWVV